MAGSTTGSVGALLQEQITPGIVNQTNTETPLLDSFGGAGDMAILGKYKVRGIKVNRNRGSYYTAEGGAPPVAGTIEIQNLMIPERYHHSAVSFTEQVLNASRSNEAAFGDVMRLNMQDVQETLRMKRNQMLWGDGRGILCYAAGAITTTSGDVDNPNGVNASETNDGTRFLQPGMWIAAVNPIGALRQTTAYKVESVVDHNTFIANATMTFSNNDYIVECVETTGTLTLANTSYMHPPMGVSGMVDNGTLVNIYFGLSRTTFPILNSTVISSVGAWGADVCQRGLDTCRKISGARINEIWMEPSVKRAHLKAMEVDRRYTAADLMTPNLGTAAARPARAADTGLKFGSIPIFQDDMQPYGTAFAWDTSMLKHAQGPTGWVDRDGSVLHLSSSAVDTYDAYFRWFEQFFSEQPNKAVKWTGITYDFVAAHVY